MHISDYLVYLWLIPVSLQIIVPLAILCGWTVLKLPLLFVSSKSSMSNTEPDFAN